MSAAIKGHGYLDIRHTAWSHQASCICGWRSKKVRGHRDAAYNDYEQHKTAIRRTQGARDR